MGRDKLIRLVLIKGFQSMPVIGERWERADQGKEHSTTHSVTCLWRSEIQHKEKEIIPDIRMGSGNGSHKLNA